MNLKHIKIPFGTEKQAHHDEPKMKEIKTNDVNYRAFK